jgi:hypothetical protein
MPLSSLAAAFVGSAEFSSIYGTQVSNGRFVDLLYQNVLGRAGDVAGRASWVSDLDRAVYARADVLIGFSESPENIAQTAPAINQGIWLG